MRQKLYRKVKKTILGLAILSVFLPFVASALIPIQVNQGGTGQSSLTATDVLFGAGTAPVGLSSNFTWDTVNHKLTVLDGASNHLFQVNPGNGFNQGIYTLGDSDAANGSSYLKINDNVLANTLQARLIAGGIAGFVANGSSSPFSNPATGFSADGNTTSVYGYAGGNNFFGADGTNLLYTFGDIDGANNSTYFSIDDSAKTFSFSNTGSILRNGATWSAPVANSVTTWGPSAGINNTSGTSSTYIGSTAGQFNNGRENVFVGAGAGGNASSTTIQSVLIGYQAGTNITSASENTVIGWNSARNLYGGTGLTTGTKNTIVGANAAGSFIGVGSNNAVFGDGSLFNVTGDGNTHLGTATGAASALTLNYTIGLGYGALVTASNQMVIGGTTGFINQVQTYYSASGVHGTYYRTSTPESNQTGTRGSFAFVDDGATGSVYVKATGTGNTGWLQLTTGGVSGSGTSGQVTFWNGSSSITGDNSYFWDNTNKFLGLGTATPLAIFHIVNTTSTTPRGMLLDQVSADTSGARITVRKARGTPGSLATIVTGDTLASWTTSGHDGTNYVDAGKILVTSTGTISTGVVPTTMALQTMTAAGALTTGVLIGADQTLTFGHYTTNGGLLYTNGSGVVAQTGAGTSTTVLHGGTSPAYSAVSLTADVTGTLPLGNGGLGITSGTSGGIPYFSSSSTIASSGALTASALVLGGGAGASPTSLALGTANQVLAMNAGATANAYTSTLSGITSTTNWTPASDDGAALGTTSLEWSDLFLASGAVINFANSNVTLTHSSGTLTVASSALNITKTGGGVLGVGTSSMILRTTNGGANITAQTLFDVDNSGTAADSRAYTYASAFGMGETHANGTRRILGWALRGVNAVNTAGSEAMDLGFYTQSAGTAASLKMTLKGTGNFSFVGKNDTYNNIATVSNGIASEYATVDLTAQSAAIGATTLYAVPSTGVGMYRVSWVAKVTTAASTSSVLGGTNGFQVKYTDQDDSVVVTTGALANENTLALSTNTTQTIYAGSIVVNCKASTNLQYLFDYTSVGVTAMQYNMHVKVEAL